MTKILICDPIAPTAVAAIRDLGVVVDEGVELTQDALADVIGDYDAIVVRSGTKVYASTLENPGRLKAIIRAGVGLDNIDLGIAQAKDIQVHNTPCASSNAVAELTIGLLFSLARYIPRADGSMKAGQWQKKQLRGTELMGKTLGVIGYGRIGKRVAEKAAALGMDVVVHTLRPVPENQVAFESLLKRADYITLHIPHTDQTHHLIGRAELAMMKPSAYLVNTARGSVVDETALYEALHDGHLAGAALDVYSEEPPQSETLRQLVALPQVIATPHIGASTYEAQDRIGDEIVELVKELFCE
jgi:D-3-phosphoglycerate dehydrogenase